MTDVAPRPRPVLVVAGTRPEAVKLAPVLAALGDEARSIHTGQHYDPELADGFAAELGLAPPDVQLDVGGVARSDQIARATRALVEHLRREPARAVVVQGDTSSALAGALAAHHESVPLVHVEAGLRSDDRAMPEEHHRVVIDHLCDLACAPTDVAAAALARELGRSSRTEVIVTGNTVVDALLAHRPSPERIAAAHARHDVTADAFVLATLHRPENVDDPDRLRALVDALAGSSVPVVLPVHPRAARHLGPPPADGPIRFVGPLPYGEFLALLASCAVCVSDSGGVQEEVSVLGRPVIVVRRSTERPEVLGTFATLVREADSVAAELAAHLVDVSARLARLRGLPTPYGDGRAGARIASEIRARWSA